MFRILLVVAWLAVTIYAIADWARTPEEEMPGRIPRIMWLIIILLTIPSLSIGSVVWLIVRAVGRAESSDGSTGSTTPRPMFPRPSRPSAPTPPPGPLAPDDDPEFLFRLERDIRRRRAAEGSRTPADEGDSAAGPGPVAGSKTSDSGDPDAGNDTGNDSGDRGSAPDEHTDDAAVNGGSDAPSADAPPTGTGSYDTADDGTPTGEASGTTRHGDDDEEEDEPDGDTPTHWD